MSKTGRLERDLADLKSTLLARVARSPTGCVELTILTVPKAGSIFLDGSTPLRSDYPNLWQWAQDNTLVIAGLFTVGNGTTTFGLPDFRGRVPVGVGTLGSDSYAVGGTGGASTKTITTSNMPSHNHHLQADGDHGGHLPALTAWNAPTGVDFGAAAWTDAGHSTGAYHNHTGFTDTNGSGTPFDVRPAYIAVNWLIWT